MYQVTNVSEEPVDGVPPADPAMRRMAVMLTPSHLGRLLAQGVLARCVAGIPVDAIFIGAYVDAARQCLMVVFEHPSFPLVPETAQFPILRPDFQIFLEES